MREVPMLVRFAYAALGAALLLGTVGATPTDPMGNICHLSLMAVGGSGEQACGSTRAGSGVVFFTILTQSEPGGAVQPAHIHKGKCGSNGPFVITLQDVVNGKSATTIPLMKWASVSRGGYYINIHRSARDLAKIVSCGNIVPTKGLL
jgi:hypothetical protein